MAGCQGNICRESGHPQKSTRNIPQGGVVDVHKPKKQKQRQRPTILIVESMCCHKEVPLVTDLLMAVKGVQKVDAFIALRQVSVLHACDGSVLPQQLADVLNQGRLGASVYKSGYTPPECVNATTSGSTQIGDER
jgi:copper chaperone CopZ